MVVDIHISLVGRLVPFGFVWHLVIYEFAVNLQSFESDVAHGAHRIVTKYKRHAWLMLRQSILSAMAIISDIAEKHILHTSSWSCAILLVVAHLNLRDASLHDILDAYIVKNHIFDQVVVACIDSEATLIVNLRLSLAKNVDIIIPQAHNAVHLV